MRAYGAPAEDVVAPCATSHATSVGGSPGGRRHINAEELLNAERLSYFSVLMV
jgi:hypothetical protein